MPLNHNDIGSPVSPVSPVSPLSPLSSRNETFGPLSQYHHPSIPKQQSQHQIPVQPTPTISLLGAERPDSPTFGYLSPVSILSPHRAPSPKPPNAAAAAPAPSQTAHLAHGPTAHLQDHMPFKSASTRFPPRNANGVQVQAPAPADEAEADSGASRPATVYLADRIPHQVAAAPTKPIKRPRYGGGVGFQDVELREGRGGDGGSRARDRGEGSMETGEERKAWNRRMGWTFAVGLVVVGVVFAVLVVEAHKPGGVAA